MHPRESPFLSLESHFASNNKAAIAYYLSPISLLSVSLIGRVTDTAAVDGW